MFSIEAAVALAETQRAQSAQVFIAARLLLIMERQSAMQLFRRWRQGTIFRSVRLEKQSVWFLVRAKTRTCRRVWQQWTRWAAMQQMHQRMDNMAVTMMATKCAFAQHPPLVFACVREGCLVAGAQNQILRGLKRLQCERHTALRWKATHCSRQKRKD